MQSGRDRNRRIFDAVFFHDGIALRDHGGSAKHRECRLASGESGEVGLAIARGNDGFSFQLAQRILGDRCVLDGRASAEGQDNCCCDSDTEHQHLVLRLQDRNSLSRKALMRALLRALTDDADCAAPCLGCVCGGVRRPCQS